MYVVDTVRYWQKFLCLVFKLSLWICAKCKILVQMAHALNPKASRQPINIHLALHLENCEIHFASRLDSMFFEIRFWRDSRPNRMGKAEWNEMKWNEWNRTIKVLCVCVCNFLHPFPFDSSHVSNFFVAKSFVVFFVVCNGTNEVNETATICLHFDLSICNLYVQLFTLHTLHRNGLNAGYAVRREIVFYCGTRPHNKSQICACSW